MTLNERYKDIAAAIDMVQQTSSKTWADAAKALMKQLIRAEVPYGKDWQPE